MRNGRASAVVGASNKVRVTFPSKIAHRLQLLFNAVENRDAVDTIYSLFINLLINRAIANVPSRSARVNKSFTGVRVSTTLFAVKIVAQSENTGNFKTKERPILP